MYFQKPYCSCAIFCCNNCGYQTEVYSNEEFVFKAEVDCHLCGESKIGVTDICIYKNDINPDMPLHLQVASIPQSMVNNCLGCLKVDSVHWTEVIVHCENCEHYSMHFSSFIEDETMDEFREWATLTLRYAKICDLSFMN